jgi:hypothetical protein
LLGELEAGAAKRTVNASDEREKAWEASKKKTEDFTSYQSDDKSSSPSSTVGIKTQYFGT